MEFPNELLGNFWKPESIFAQNFAVWETAVTNRMPFNVNGMDQLCDLVQSLSLLRTLVSQRVLDY